MKARCCPAWGVLTSQEKARAHCQEGGGRATCVFILSAGFSSSIASPSRALGSWAVLWLLALAVRLIYFYQIRDTELASMLLGDAEVYDAWAREIAAGNWLGDRVFYQAPLYPYFLAVIYAVAGHILDIVRLVQIVLGSFSCVLMGLAAARFFSRRAGLLTTVLMALCPALIFFDGLVQKAVLDVFCFTLMWWLAARADERWRGWVLLGAAAGLLALTRENALI